MLSIIAVLALAGSPGVFSAPSPQTSSVNFSLIASSTNLAPGQIADITIQFNASAADPVSAAQAYLNFDPNVLQVVDASGNPANDVTPGPIFAPTANDWQVLQNSVDNATGQIDVAGGKKPGTGTDVTIPASFATFRLKALTSTSSADVLFNSAAPRQTKAVFVSSQSPNPVDITGTLTSLSFAITNTPPLANADSATVAEGGAVTELDSTATSLLANDSDPDGDNLSVATTPASGPANGSLILNSDGTFSYTHDGSETASDSFVYQVCDDGSPSECSTATVNIAVTLVNDPPTAGPDSGASFTTDEDTAFTTGNVLSNDTDSDASDILSVQSFDDTGALGLVTDNGNGAFIYDPNGQFEALNAGQQATDSFSYTVTDSNGGGDTATVTITITGVDDPTDLTFSLSLQGRGNSSTPWIMPFAVEFYAPGASTLAASAAPTAAISTSSASSFMVMNIQPGTYDIWVKGENTLAQLVNDFTVSPASNVINLGEQIGGDAAGSGAAPDNVVDGQDYSAFLLVPFGSLTSGLPPGQQHQDHNRDGIIDIADYAIIVGNFNTPGALRP